MAMKKFILCAATLLLATLALTAATTPKDVVLKWTEATDLTMVGKLFSDTENPYWRVDTTVYKGFTKRENQQVRQSSGIAVVFATNSSVIQVKARYAQAGRGGNTNVFSAMGFDLYIKKDGKWLWAGSTASNTKEKPARLVANMNDEMKECLLYLPLYSEVESVQIGVEKDAAIKKIKNPFKYRIAVFGSSFTHGSSTSRAGMAWPAQLSRKTGFQFISLGCSGNCKLQPYFANALVHAENIDAYVFDAFSNPSAKVIEQRLFPFIEKFQKHAPGKPLIFLKTIYREKCNFDEAAQAGAQRTNDAAERMMQEACRKYDNVYWITSTNATAPSHETTVDGIHPDNYGYTLWMESVCDPILEILAKYKIK